MLKISLFRITLALAMLASASSPARFAHAQAGAIPAAQAAMTQGEVRKVDKAAGKVTLKHGEIKNLDMAAMTMVFRVQNPAVLDQLKEGDKVRFTAEKIGGALTLTRVEPAP